MFALLAWWYSNRGYPRSSEARSSCRTDTNTVIKAEPEVGEIEHVVQLLTVVHGCVGGIPFADQLVRRVMPRCAERMTLQYRTRARSRLQQGAFLKNLGLSI